MQRFTGPNSAAGSQACAVCKYQRRKCTSNCLLAPFFPAHRHKDFLNTRKLFGVRNITKLIENFDSHQRNNAMTSLIFEANAKANDPVGGCCNIIRGLNRQIAWHESELELVLHQLAICKAQDMITQSGQQQHMVQIVNDDQNQVNTVDQSLECFNMYDAMPVHDQHCQEDEFNIIQCSYGVSSSLSPVYNMSETNLVKIESELSVIPKIYKQVSPVGEDIKPRLAVFDDKSEQAIPFDSEGSNIHLSDKLVSKEGTGSIQHQLKHDLNDAASLFTLTNGKG